MIIKNQDKLSFLDEVLDEHLTMRGAYFFRSVGNASARRWYERQHSRQGSFNLKGHKYNIVQDTSCSCRNVYYTLRVHVDNVKKDVRALKRAYSILSGISYESKNRGV